MTQSLYRPNDLLQTCNKNERCFFVRSKVRVRVRIKDAVRFQVRSKVMFRFGVGSRVKLRIHLVWKNDGRAVVVRACFILTVYGVHCCHLNRTQRKTHDE